MVVAGPTRTMETWKVTTSMKQQDIDELESDVDHHEMVKAYACDAYLSRWLPDIKDRQTGNEDDGITSQNICSHVEHTEQQETRERRPTSLDSIPKTPSQNRQQERGGDDVVSEAKVTKEARRKTYFEAIKCSPMKLRRSIATQKTIQAPKEENITKRFSLRQHAAPNHNNNKPSSWTRTTNNEDYLNSSLNLKQTNSRSSFAEDVATRGVWKPRSTMTPRVVEMTGGPLGELGSLCFKTKEADRRHNDVMYTTLAGGKMRKLHRHNKSGSSGRAKSGLLVRCESVMIYPKVLVNPKIEKAPKPALFYPKEAWRDAVPAVVQKPLSTETKRTKAEKDYRSKAEKDGGDLTTRLPDLPENEIDPKDAQPNPSEKLGAQMSPSSGASTKIIVPFGEEESKQLTESNSHNSNIQNSVDKSEKSQENPSGTSCKEQHGVRRHVTRKTRPSRFSESSLRKVPGVVIGVTQLELPGRRTALATREQITSSVQNTRLPIRKLQLLNTDVRDLYLGNENVPPSTKNVSPRYVFSPRKRVDFARKNVAHTQQQQSRALCSDDEQENNTKLFTGRSENDLSLQIGGTGLLKAEQDGDLKENFEQIKQLEEKEKRVHFNVLVPHSRYFT